MIRREPTKLPFLTACTVGLAASVVGCGGGGGDVGPPATPAAITIASGAGQIGEAGSVLAQPIGVRVTSSSGSPVEGSTVNFVVGQASGTVAAAAAATNSDGVASTTWTVGTSVGSNLDTVFASVAGITAPAVFTASVIAAAGARLESVSGDAQNGVAGQPLAQPLVVVARDQYGNPRSEVDIAWSVISGGGSISPGTSTTGTNGEASAIWTPGSGGVNTAQADASGLAGSPINFDATITAPGALALISITPVPMVEGQAATLTGAGFSTTPGNNKVKIDGVDATVTAASAGSLTVLVPQSNCQPARSAAVQVKVGSRSSNLLTHDLNPAAFTSVAVGQELVLQDPAQFCLEFAPSVSPEDYLIGVQSTSEVVASLTPVKLTSTAASGPLAGAQLPELARMAATGHPTSGPIDASLYRRARRVAAEAELRAEERQQVYPLARQAFRARTQERSRPLGDAIPPGLQPGDVTPIRYPGTGNTCTSFVEIQAVVRVVGQRGVWLEDQDNPANGLTQQDIQHLSDQFDTQIYSTVTAYFGSPTDLDGNSRIAIVLTDQVNKLRPGIVGHVALADLVPRSLCASSDEGEIYYGVVPDPTGSVGIPVSRELVLAIAVQTIAHEFTHIIQFGLRSIVNGLQPQPTWVFEGQAVLAEEITGHVYEGRTPGQNYGFNVAFNQDDPASLDWYSFPFVSLIFYYGFRDQASKVPDAPEECTWLAGKPENPGPCLGNLEVYGAPWSLLRWMSDQFGAHYPAGESGLHRALILNPAEGYAALSAAAGLPVKTLLAQWAAALYVDDRIPSASTSLQFTSWNLLDIENNLTETARLVPRSRGFTSFSDAFSVRAGSSAYFRVSGTSRPGTAIRIRSGSDESLPAIMQAFIVRLQ
jgi:hypothetical protein